MSDEKIGGLQLAFGLECVCDAILGRSIADVDNIRLESGVGGNGIRCPVSVWANRSTSIRFQRIVFWSMTNEGNQQRYRGCWCRDLAWGIEQNRPSEAACNQNCNSFIQFIQRQKKSHERSLERCPDREDGAKGLGFRV